MQVKKNAFKGLTHFNGQKVKPAIVKETGEQLVGKSGDTLGYELANPGTIGLVFLTSDQVEQ